MKKKRLLIDPFNDSAEDAVTAMAPIRKQQRPLLAEPVIDVFERDHEIVVTAELPGTEKKDIALKVMENGLKLRIEKRARRKQEKFEPESATYAEENRFEEHAQFIPFSASAIAEQASATYNNGVLEVRVPKQERKKGHEIKVE
ncbi:Hsp20/alpha crystallin family protein [Candidatus Micrarchaeota archaeon]|nr:Hsp20/alpha crystallin family protein [Candidatus Micrarchaeota archaeon]